MNLQIRIGLILICFMPQVIFAQAKDLETLKYETDLNAIAKLEATLDKVALSSRPMVELRLGDLYAESARRQFQNEIESGDKLHKQSKLQREKAIQYYKKSLKSIPDIETYSNTQMKLASLYSELGLHDKALDTLNSVIKNKKTPKDIQSIAIQHRGHAYFSSGNFKMAEIDYLEVLKNKRAIEDPSLVLYRLAWSQVQLQKLDAARENYHQAVKVIAQKNNKEGLEVFVDYATLIIQDKKTTPRDIDNLISMAHPELRNQIELESAEEAFRIARYDIARPLYLKISQNPKLEDHIVILAKLRLVLIENKNQDSEAINSFKHVLKDSKSCKKSLEKCELIKKELRSFTLQVHKLKKARPDHHVLNTYKAYLDAYPEEAALFITAAGVASYLDQHDDARTLFEKGILLEKDPKIKEDYLLANLGRLNSNSDENDKILSYLFYINHGNNQSIKNQIELELAQMDFKKKKYDEAFIRSDRLAKNKQALLSLRLKAAEVAIKSLINQQNHDEVFNTAKTYASLFESKKTYYSEIAKKAKISMLLAATQNPSKLTNHEVETKFAEIRDIAIRESNIDEKKNLFKNLNRIAFESNNSKLKAESLILFLSLKNLEQNEIVEATRSLYQLYLDDFEFKKAFYLAKSNQHAIQVSDLELAQLADIAELKYEAIKEYQKALKNKKIKSTERASAASRIILLSQTKRNTLPQYIQHLKANKQVLDQTLSILFISEPSLRSQIIALTKNMRLPNLQIAQSRIRDYQTLKKLQFRPDSSLKLTHSPNSLKNYQSYLKKLDQDLLQYQKSSHAAIQILLLKAIHHYNTKFVEDLAKLPIPKEVAGTTTESTYHDQIKSLSRPYLEKAILAKKKSDQLEINLINDLKKERLVARHEIIPFLDAEARLIENKFIQFSTQINSGDLIQISYARFLDWKDVRSDLKSQLDQNFYTLETQFGNPVLASFLSSRNDNKKLGERL